MSKRGDGDVVGQVHLCRASDLREITEEAARYSWSARLDQATIRALDADDLHLLVPFTRNGGAPGVPDSHRCYLWYKHAGQNNRSCVVIDVSDRRLFQFERPSVRQLNRLVFMLVEQLPIQYLDPFNSR
jgi:hypothetical protein